MVISYGKKTTLWGQRPKKMHEPHAAIPGEYWQVTAVPHTVDHWRVRA